jgi:Fe-S cluster assembly protein SufD
VVRAFFADIIQQIGVPLVQERLMEAIEAELEAAMSAEAAAPTAGAAGEKG